jgi:hypothetical protein
MPPAAGVVRAVVAPLGGGVGAGAGHAGQAAQATGVAGAAGRGHSRAGGAGGGDVTVAQPRTRNGRVRIEAREARKWIFFMNGLEC